MTVFAAKVNALLKERDWAVSHLEQLAGLGSGTLNKLLKNGTDREPSARTLAAVSKALGIPESALIGAPQRAQPRTESQPRTPQTAVVYDDPYPSRGVVLALLRGKVDANVLAALASIRFNSEDPPGDPGEAFWLAEVKRLKRQLDELEREDILLDEVQPEPGDRMPPLRASTSSTTDALTVHHGRRVFVLSDNRLTVDFLLT